MKRKARLEYARAVSSEFAQLTPSWDQFDSAETCLASVLRVKVVNNACSFFIWTTVARPAGSLYIGVSAVVGWINEVPFDGTTDIEYNRPSGILSFYQDAAVIPEVEYDAYFVGLERLKRAGGVFGPLPIREPGDFEKNAALLVRDVTDYGLPFLRIICRRRYDIEL